MYFPDYRPRRLRKNENFRRMVRETSLSVDDMVYPLFVIEGKGVKKPISSMPGNFQMSVDHLVKEVEKTKAAAKPRKGRAASAKKKTATKAKAKTTRSKKKASKR